MNNAKLDRLVKELERKCERCNHKWLIRDLRREPVRCPSCGTPYWNRPKKKSRQEVIREAIGEARVQ